MREVLLVPAVDGGLAGLAETLTGLGYRVVFAGDAADDPEFDLAVVDVRTAEGWERAAALADGRLILIVDGIDAMRRGFELGADDCVLADARREELAARCDAVLRRTGVPQATGSSAVTDPIVYADRRLWVNFDSRQVWVGGRPARLTPREFRLLKELLRNQDTTLTHEALLEAVWEREPASGRTPEVLKQYIWRLRQKIEPDPQAPALIVTDPGAGYRFVSRPR